MLSRVYIIIYVTIPWVPVTIRFDIRLPVC